jgi:hypothetical protein
MAENKGIPQFLLSSKIFQLFEVKDIQRYPRRYIAPTRSELCSSYYLLKKI